MRLGQNPEPRSQGQTPRRATHLPCGRGILGHLPAAEAPTAPPTRTPHPAPGPRHTPPTQRMCTHTYPPAHTHTHTHRREPQGKNTGTAYADLLVRTATWRPGARLLALSLPSRETWASHFRSVSFLTPAPEVGAAPLQGRRGDGLAPRGARRKCSRNVSPPWCCQPDRPPACAGLFAFAETIFPRNLCCAFVSAGTKGWHFLAALRLPGEENPQVAFGQSSPDCGVAGTPCPVLCVAPSPSHARPAMSAWVAPRTVIALFHPQPGSTLFTFLPLN